MIRSFAVSVGAGIAIGVATLSLAGCGGGVTIPAANLEKQVTDFVAKNTKETAKNVKCPDETEARVGVAVDCTFTASDGAYVAHVEITKVDGEDVYYHIASKHV
jgi:Domain of unknown function (DUF4333)